MIRPLLRLAPLWPLLGLISLALLRNPQRASAGPPRPADESFDVLLRGGRVYDGSGQAPRVADLGIRGSTIAAVGDLGDAAAKSVLDVKGLAVAPGFINMLFWSNESLLVDGRGQSELRQGVTTQILGEGWTMGPANATLKGWMKAEQTDIQYNIDWTTLGEYLALLQQKGVSQNVASFVGATTVREHVLGWDKKKPTADELERMRQLVESAMRDGALGVGAALEYAPAYYADTEELIELCKVAARFQGKYITHLRSEGDRLLEGIDEAIRIGRAAQVPVEVYHLKATGRDNWTKMDTAIARIEAARAEGLAVTANMYPYTAAAAPLVACIPPWAMEGGEVAMRQRLRDFESRKRVIADIRAKTDWANFYHNAGSPANIVPIAFKQGELKPLQGKTPTPLAARIKVEPVPG